MRTSYIRVNMVFLDLKRLGLVGNVNNLEREEDWKIWDQAIIFRPNFIKTFKRKIFLCQ